jgi:hypothetical protein
MHGERNAGGGEPPQLDLTPREALSALRVNNMLRAQAEQFPGGLPSLAVDPSEHVQLLVLAVEPPEGSNPS